MKKISEFELHMYVMNKSLLELDVISEIEKRMNVDEQLLTEINEIKEFYNNINNLDQVPPYNIFSLIPLEINTTEEDIIKLAAQNEIMIDNEFKYVRTFLSSEKYVMVRMFHNSALNEYDFYLIRDDSGDVNNAIIKIPFLNEELITNEKGIAKIKLDYIPEDIELIVILR